MSSPAVLVKLPRLDPLGGRSRSAYIKLLQQRLRGRVHAAYLFGSVARKHHRAGSDVDLIVIADSARPFVDRFRDFDDLLDTTPQMDLLIYTPDEFQRIRAGNPSGFWKSVLTSAVKII